MSPLLIKKIASSGAREKERWAQDVWGGGGGRLLR